MPGTAGSKYGFYDVPRVMDKDVKKYRKLMNDELSIQLLDDRDNEKEKSEPKAEQMSF